MRKRKKKLLKGTGKRSKYPRNSKSFNDEDAPMKMSIKRPYRRVNYYDGPYAYVDHSVIRRLLKKHIGRPWDLVWQEICAENDPRTYEGHEVRTWMEFAVEKNCFIDDDGTVRNEHGHKLGSWMDEYYIHPTSGLLCYIPHGPRWKREGVTQKVFEMDGTLYHEHDGIWYRVTMRELGHTIASYKYISTMYESFGVTMWAASNRELTSVLKNKYGLSANKKYWYCSSKESANGKEISKLKKKYNLDDESKAA